MFIENTESFKIQVCIMHIISNAGLFCAPVAVLYFCSGIRSERRLLYLRIFEFISAFYIFFRANLFISGQFAGFLEREGGEYVMALASSCQGLNERMNQVEAEISGFSEDHERLQVQFLI